MIKLNIYKQYSEDQKAHEEQRKRAMEIKLMNFEKRGHQLREVKQEKTKHEKLHIHFPLRMSSRYDTRASNHHLCACLSTLQYQTINIYHNTGPLGHHSTLSIPPKI